MNRQKLLLLILLALLSVALIWSYYHMPRQKTVSGKNNAPGQPLPLPVSGKPAASRSTPVTGGSSSLALELLNREPSAFKGYRRNLFKPIFVDEIKLMKLRSAAIRPAIPPSAVPAKIMPVQPMIPTEPPKRELARFTFLGFLKKDNRRTIFLARGNDIILVKKGDTFAGRYQAASITEQALTIQVTDTGEEIVIPLIDNQSLVSMR